MEPRLYVYVRHVYSGFELTREFNPKWQNRDPGCKFAQKVQPWSSFWRLDLLDKRVKLRDQLLTTAPRDV